MYYSLGSYILGGCGTYWTLTGSTILITQWLTRTWESSFGKVRQPNDFHPEDPGWVSPHLNILFILNFHAEEGYLGAINTFKFHESRAGQSSFMSCHVLIRRQPVLSCQKLWLGRETSASVPRGLFFQSRGPSGLGVGDLFADTKNCLPKSIWPLVNNM